MGFGTISNTFINSNGHSVAFHYNSLSPFGCCRGFGGFTPGCFGFGFNPMCGNPYAFSAGAGLGFAAGVALTPLLPSVFKGIGQGCSWLWNKAIVPAAKGVWEGVKWVGNGIAKGAKWVWNGVKNLWNNIFHKDSKAKQA